jgi:hypothetical protein
MGAAFAPPAGAADGWVGAGYFGINFQELRDLQPSQRGRHLARIAKLGIHDIRLGIAWPRVEPLPPVDGTHQYRWDEIDGEIAVIARHGIRAQANITQTPRWNADAGIIGEFNCNRTSSWAPADITPYAPLARAIAARYGRGGTFWRTHPSLPAKPMVRYEIWNEPNLRGGWCPRPQPERYADMFLRAARAIKAVDRRSQVVTGGVAPAPEENIHYLGISEFMERATKSQPRLIRKADGAAVHIYPPTGHRKQLDRLAWFRQQLRQGGIPNRTPMLINEIGWATNGGMSAVSEAERAEAYTAATTNFPRTNCNVMGILPQSWTSDQQSAGDPEDWYGIAGPLTAKPYPSARAYSRGLRLMRGERPQPPPRDPVMACPGMPAPKPPGPSSPCTVIGTPGDDDLTGTGGRDVICALGGRDVIRARGGSDIVLGAGGGDRVRGGPGSDRIKGKGGRDRLGGGGGGDELNGGRGRDRLGGGPGDDRLEGGPSGDVLRGGPGKDRLRGGPGRDRTYA